MIKILYTCLFLLLAAIPDSAWAALDSLPGEEWHRLVEKGYLSASELKSGWQPGNKYKIHSIQITQIPSLPDFGLKEFEAKVFSKSTVQKMLTRIKNQLLNSGFIFSRLSLDFNAYDSSHIDVVIEIQTGSQYKLGEPIFEGSKTKADILRKMSLLKPGEDLNMEQIQNAGEKLSRSSYFSEVYLKGLYRDSLKNLIYPKYYLEDSKANQLSGLFGYNSENDARQKPFSGFAQIHLVNLLGTARDFDFNFSVQNSETEVMMDYREPFILSLPIGLGFHVSVLIEDSVYDENTVSLSMFQDINFRSRYIVSAGTQSNQSYFLQNDSLLSEASSAKLTSLEFGYDWRDKALYTRRGGLAVLYLQGIVREERDSTHYLAQTRLGLDYWQPLGKRWLFHPSLNTSLVYPLDLGLRNRGNLFKTGGAGSIRGYRDNEFLTNAFTYLNLELHYLLSSRNSFLIFVDPGLINKPVDDFYWNKVVGYGAGVDLGSRDWVFGLRFGLSPQRGFSDGVIHVKLENRF